MLNISDFVKKNVIFRDHSMFLQDITANEQELISKVQDKRVLVVGGAGSIGSSFIRAILPYAPKQLCVVDINENGLTELTRDLRSSYKLYVPSNYITYPLSYSDPIFEKIFRQNKGFDIIANFSAHKHVRSEKDCWSIQALLENNVLKARKFLDLLVSNPPEHFFCVSTDKAANPVNIMGASKRIMEDLILSYSDKFNISTARFANVAFSNGSLPAGFLERIKKRQPLSAPYDIKRYFVSEEESGQICMLACLLGHNQDIFFPKLNEDQMVSFSYIAEKLLAELGYKPYKCADGETAKQFAASMPSDSKDYPVFFFSSDTTGEKSYEEFFVEGEHLDLERFSALGVIDKQTIRPKDEVYNFINEITTLFEKNNITKQEIVSVIKSYLPNFNHIEKGMNLDQRM